MSSFDEKGNKSGQPFNLWLQQKFAEYVSWYSTRNNKIPSQNEWARHLGITNTNLSQYMLGNRSPDVRQADLLAEKLGPQVYDRLGLPRKMPRNPILYFVADNWNEMGEDDWKEIQEIIKNKLAEKDRRNKPKREESFT